MSQNAFSTINIVFTMQICLTVCVANYMHSICKCSSAYLTLYIILTDTLGWALLTRIGKQTP